MERITFEASRWEIALLEIGTCDTIAANRLLDACAEVGIPVLRNGRHQIGTRFIGHCLFPRKTFGGRKKWYSKIKQN